MNQVKRRKVKSKRPAAKTEGVPFAWGGPRPRAGRPPLPPTVQRSERVTVNLTRGERAELRRLAEAAGVSAGEVLRRALLAVLQPKRGVKR